MELRLSDPQHATMIDFDDGDRLRVLTGQPIPPGTRLSAAVLDLEVRGKVLAARRSQHEGQFEVVLKLTDVPRDARRRLLELAASARL